MPIISWSTFLDTYRPHAPFWQRRTPPVASSEIGRRQDLQTRVPMRVKHILLDLLILLFALCGEK